MILVNTFCAGLSLGIAIMAFAGDHPAIAMANLALCFLNILFVVTA